MLLGSYNSSSTTNPEEANHNKINNTSDSIEQEKRQKAQAAQIQE
jgi:hypothetical protein